MLTYSHETLVMLTLNTTSIIIIAEILDVEQQSINLINQKWRISIKAIHFCIGEIWGLTEEPVVCLYCRAHQNQRLIFQSEWEPLSHLNWFWSFHSFNINTYMYMYIFTSSHSMYLTWSSSLVCMYLSLTGSFRITLYSQVPMV